VSSPEKIEQQSHLRREDAFDLAAALGEVGVYVRLEGSVRGWRVTLRGHTDLVDLAKVLDTMKARLGRGDGEALPLHALYQPFGGDGWPDVAIYAGSKP
jgi:hypothetical protein